MVQIETFKALKAFDYRFNAVFQRLCPSQRLRQILRNRHYLWGDDSWLYFISWIIMQGRFIYRLAEQAAPELLPVVHAQSEPAEGYEDLPTWLRP